MAEPINRREFIKATTAVVGGLIASQAAGPIVAFAAGSEQGEVGERGYWERFRFFEDVGHFDAEMERQVREGLDEFAEKFGPLINSPDTGIGFNKDVWQDLTGGTVDVLARIRRVRDTLRAPKELDTDAANLLQQDYYDAASVIWGLLRVGEKFGNKPEEFVKALKDGEVKKDTGFSDPFLGDEMFGIKSQWACTNEAWNGEPTTSRFKDFMNTAGSVELNVWTSNDWWQRRKGPAGLSVYTKDPNLPGRPAPFAIEVADDPAMADEISQILEGDRLDRVGINFSAINTQGGRWQGTYFHDGNTDGSARNILVEAVGGLTKEQMKIFPYLTHAMAIHEGAHALWELIPFIKDDIKMFRNRVFVDRALKIFRPYPTYSRFTRPGGDFYKKINLAGDGSFSTGDWNKRYRVINNGTVTEYAARKYAQVDLWPINDFFEKGSLLCRRMPVNRPGPVIENPVFSVVDKVYKSSPEIGSVETSFAEFWNGFSDAVQNNPDIHLSSFERWIFAEIGRNAATFDSPERSDYVFRENWKDYLTKVVVPLAAIQMYRQDPEFFVDKYVEHIKNPGVKKSIAQSFEVFFKAVAGERPWRGKQPSVDKLGYRAYGYQPGFNRGYNNSDLELFAELTAYNHVRKMDGVQNEIPDSTWQAIDGVINSLIDDLITDGLALKPNSEQAM